MNHRTHTSLDRAPEPSTGRQIRAFLADDDPFTLVWLAKSLATDRRVTIVASATDGHKAFQSAMLSQPDLVLIDSHMPGLNATDVTRWLKQTQYPPVVLVVTSDGSPESQAKSLAAGADAFLIKDESLPAQLQTAIQQFFADGIESK
jgi:DNA-binding NarL/FixJ family response regulator